MKPFLLILFFATTASAAVTTQPLSPSPSSPAAIPASTAQRPADVQQLSTLLRAATYRLEHPSSPAADSPAAVAASLVGQHVTGHIVIDETAEISVKAHLVSAAKLVLTADEQRQIAEAKAAEAKARTDHNNAVAIDKSVHSFLSASVAANTAAAADEAARHTAGVIDLATAAATARLPIQRVVITYNDLLPSTLKPGAIIPVLGYITHVVPTIDDGIASFNLTVSPTPAPAR